MRYDKRVTFIKLGTPAYDPATGDYIDGEPEETTKPADVYQTSEKLQKLIYDGIRQDAITIQLQNKYTKAFDMIRYDGRLYRVDTRKRCRTKELLLCTEYGGQ
jgi:hypothetical protein